MLNTLSGTQHGTQSDIRCNLAKAASCAVYGMHHVAILLFFLFIFRKKSIKHFGFGAVKPTVSECRVYVCNV